MKKNKVILFVVFAFLFAIWALLFAFWEHPFFTIYPQSRFEIFAVTDSIADGFSTSALTLNEETVSAEVNIRSGKAFPYAGIGFNLRSLDHRPAPFFDFSKYDSLEIIVAARRMNTIKLRILTEDPNYSKADNYLSYRPLERSVPVQQNYTTVKTALNDFKTPDWWLALQGLEEDDRLNYFFRSNILEILNGEGTLRGIPDEIEIKKISFWKIDKNIPIIFWSTFGILMLAFICCLKKSLTKKTSKNAEKDRLKKAVKLLQTTDKSIAEIAIELGYNSPGHFEKKFKKEYRQKPLSLRK